MDKDGVRIIEDKDGFKSEEEEGVEGEEVAEEEEEEDMDRLSQLHL